MAESTADTVNHLVDKIGDGLGQIANAISSHAPEAWKLVVEGGYASAMAQMVIGAGFGVLTIALATTSAVLIRSCLTQAKADNEDIAITCGVAGALSAAAAAFFLLVTLAYVADSHAVAMLVAPEATTARDLLAKAL